MFDTLKVSLTDSKIYLNHRDKGIKIEEAIDIYVMRLKINSCFVAFVPPAGGQIWAI